MSVGPAFSIALCTYNGGRFLREQLQSILDQSHQPFELIACDDGSTDETIRILQDYAASSPFPFHILRNETNLGSTANFEQAILNCQGDVIVLCDQDDRWHVNKLLRLHSVFTKACDTALVFSDAMIVDAKGQLLDCQLWPTAGFHERLQATFRKRSPLDVLLKQNVVTGATMAFETRWRDRVLPIPENWVHDAWIALVIAMAGGHIELLSEPLIDYRQHPGQQIGVPLNSRGGVLNLWQQLMFARQLTAVNFETQCQQFSVAAAKAKELCGREHPIPQIIAEKMHHLRLRAEIKRQPWRNTLLAIRDLVCGRYHRYSLGCGSFLLDVSYVLPDRIFEFSLRAPQ